MWARHFPFYPYLYPSSLHGLVSRGSAPSGHANYLTALPNPGAGIGHQMANWIAGYQFAGQFGCRYAYASFSDPDWDELLNLGDGEVTIAQARAEGHRIRRLPLFDEQDGAAIARIRHTIASYANRKILFVMERDQFHRAQYGVQPAIARKFAASAPRQAANLIYDPKMLNIAVHVRRGDVSREAAEANPNILLRWQDIGYFERVLDAVLDQLPERKLARIHVFSQGSPGEFTSFSRHPGSRLCLDMSARDTFRHLAAADILIGSKSGFSYCSGLLGHGVRIMSTPFWHGYPSDPLWICADSFGNFDAAELTAALAALESSRQPAGESINPDGQQ